MYGVKKQVLRGAIDAQHAYSQLDKEVCRGRFAPKDGTKEMRKNKKETRRDMD